MFVHYGTHHGQAEACGWGRAGGGDFTPQRRDYSGYESSTARLSVTQEQAHDIVANYVKRLNPNFTVGNVVDGGTHYRFDIMSDGKPVDRLAVEKSTGLIRFIQ